MQYQKYLKDTDQISNNSEYKADLKASIEFYNKSQKELGGFVNGIDYLKKKASNVKRKTLVDLENYLKEFESNYTKNGGQLIWAPQKEDAINAIVKILKNHGVKNIVKSNFLLSKELNLNKHLKESDFNTLDVELNSFIDNLDSENKIDFDIENNLEELANILKAKYAIKDISNWDEINSIIKNKIKNTILTADAGISGVDFLISDIGGLSISDNDNSATLVSSLPKVHIAVVGIEQIIPSIKDVDVFWSLSAFYNEGKKLFADHNIILGPSNTSNGVENQYIILIDNGRSEVLKTEYQFEAMNCIQCKACSNICPVYHQIGDAAYNTPYTGPIGSVLMPLMQGFENYNHLAYACTDCGKCDDICPVGIPIYQLILRNRKQAVDNGFEITNLKRSIKFYKMAMNYKSLVEKIPLFIKQSISSYAVSPSFSKGKQLPKLAKKTFSQLWKEKENLVL